MPDAGNIKASIDFDANGLQRAVDRAMARASKSISTQIDQGMDRAESRIKSGFRRTGALLAGFLGLDAVADRLIQAGTYIATLGAKTERTLNTFQSVSKATGAQMEKVSARARELGNDISIPGASAADAAEAMTELAKGGLDVSQSMKAAQGTMRLAAAAQIEGAEAARIQVAALNAFSLGAGEAGRVADVLANAANASAAEIGEVGSSLSQAAAVAHAAGLSIEETATFLAQFANAGIAGSDAGTLLRTMLLRLQNPAGVAAREMRALGLNVYDANGNMVSGEEIVKRLITATEGMTRADRDAALAKIFGADAIRGVNVLLEQGLEGHRKTAEAMERQGSAAEVAAARSQGLSGAISGLVSMIESLAIEIYQNVSPAMEDWLRGTLEKLPGVIDDAAAYTRALGKALEPAARLVGMFIEAAKPGAIIAFKGALAGLLGTMEILGALLEPVADLIEAHEGAFQAVVGPLVAATLAYQAFKRAVSGIGRIRTDLMAGASRQIERYNKAMRGATGVTSRFRVVGGGLMGAMGGPWGLAIGAAATAIGIFANKQAQAEANIRAVKETLDQQTGAVTKNTREWAINRLTTEGAMEHAKTLGINLGTLTRAVLGEEKAVRQVNAALRAAERSKGRVEETSRALAGGLTATSAAMGEERESAEALRGVMKALGVELNTAQRQTRLEAEAHREAKRAKDGNKASGDLLTGTEAKLYGQTYDTAKAFDEEARAARNAKRAIQNLNNEAIEGISAQISFEEASDNLRKTIKSLTREGIKNKKMLDVSTPAGRKLYQAFIDLATSSEGVEGGMKRARRQIYNTIRPLVNSKQKAWELTNQFFKLKNNAEKVPERVHTRVTTAGIRKAINQGRSLRSLLNDIDGRYTARVVTIYSQVGARSRANNFFGGTGYRPPGQATGGPVFGSGSGVSDEVPRMLSNGEHVMTAAEVDAAGGHGNVMRLRQALLDGALRFAEGGAFETRTRPRATTPRVETMRAADAAALVEHLSVEVGKQEQLPEALDETLFHLRRIKRGGRYATV